MQRPHKACVQEKKAEKKAPKRAQLQGAKQGSLSNHTAHLDCLRKSCHKSRQKYKTTLYLIPPLQTGVQTALLQHIGLPPMALLLKIFWALQCFVVLFSNQRFPFAIWAEPAESLEAWKKSWFMWHGNKCLWELRSPGLHQTLSPAGSQGRGVWDFISWHPTKCEAEKASLYLHYTLIVLHPFIKAGYGYSDYLFPCLRVAGCYLFSSTYMSTAPPFFITWPCI